MGDATDLLQTARDVLLAEVVPHLPAGQKYQALMVANAMAIAARESEGDAPPPEPPELSGRIRAGEFDPGAPEHDAIAAWLLEATRARCAISNPKAL